ncbi:MAG: tetratricopeptide repeat protein [Bacteroidales bacterium]|nr:tetratricopeptide repeat protein [Bacteroidales bacterium]
MRLLKIKYFYLVFLFLWLIPSVLVNAQEKGHGRKKNRHQEEKTMIDKKASTEAFIDGTKARLLGDLVKAASYFNKCLELNPSDDAAMYELSQIYYTQDDFNTAATLIEKAIEIDPSNPYYRLLAVDIYGKSGRKEDLLKTCQQLVKKFPGNADYLYELASAYLMLGKGDDAINTYNAIEEIIGINEEVSLQKHRIYLLQNKAEKAVREIEQLIEENPSESVRYYSMLAEIYMQDKKPDIAAEYYKKIILSDPANPYVHISLSDYYRKKGDSLQSLEELKTGFANPTLDIDTKLRILMAYYSLDEFYNKKKPEISELSSILLKAHPSDSKALSLSADLMFNDAKYNEARELLRQVIAIDSSRYATWESLMQTEAALSDWQALQDESARALDLFPLQPLPYFFNGISNLQLKKPAEAIKSLNTGAKFVTTNEQLLLEFYTYLGDAYNQSGQYALSDENYEKVLKSTPNNAYVLNNYAYYLSLRGEKLDKALTMASKAVSLAADSPAYMDTYGWVLYKNGSFAEAKEWVEKAILASPGEDADLLEHMGDIMFKLGDQNQALEYWKKAKNAGGTGINLEKKIKEKNLFE